MVLSLPLSGGEFLVPYVNIIIMVYMIFDVSN